MLAGFIWSSGSSPIRNVVGATTLNSYMLPMFGQSWSVFAPNPIRSNTSFDVRATKPGTDEPTQWYSISGRDVDMAIKHHLLPSRLYLTNFQLMSHYRSAFDKLNDDGQAAVGTSYKNPSWSSALRNRLAGGSEASPDVATFISNARAVNALASAVAEARWGEHIDRVQIRTINTPVPPYDDRLDDDYHAQSTYIMTGWRPVSDVKNVDSTTINRMYGAKAGNR
ncbi:hypothetical protein GCM10027344_08660 [Spelaeicoccus albus]